MGLWGKKKDYVRVPVEQLQPGMHVSLAERWWDHPFLLNEFTLENEGQISLIRALGMTSVLWCEAASDKKPLDAGQPPAPLPSGAELVARARAQREERRRKTGQARERTVGAGKAYLAAATQLREAFSLACSAPRAAVDKAMGIVTEVADAFASNDEVSIVLLTDRMSSSNLHTHAINVMLLTLLIAKAHNAGDADLKDIGLGALFHDVGKLKVPDAVRMKPEADWTRADHNYMQMHCELGAKLTLNLPEFGPGARAIVAMHHEHWNGSGHPFKLAGEKIPLLARYAAVADRYDELCNPMRMQDSITPSEALSRMYKVEGACYDTAVLSRFIKSMGVYPPGSLVELSNGAIGLVTSVNRNDSLRPMVTLWQENTKAENAPIIDLSVEPELGIKRSMRVGELEPEVREYLNPRARTAYFYARAAAA
jgi:HD-GYP domain-containing protein (c-di-GMP phosphodiesterase class II)